MWSVKTKLVSGAAQGETSPALLNEDTAEKKVYEDEMIEHWYVLRPDLTISVELPADLSSLEAQRLSQFIATLSFEEQS